MKRQNFSSGTPWEPVVGYAAVGTGAIFLTMGVIATTTKRDFSFMCA